MLAVKRLAAEPHRRPWIARIDGVDVRFGWKRAFLRPLKDFSGARRNFSGAMRGLVLEFLLPPGVYEAQEYTRKGIELRRFYRSEEGSVSEISEREVVEWILQNDT